jgi:hypothetical protein
MLLEVKVLMDEEKMKVITCEKQRRHDQKMKKCHSEITNSSLIQTWLFNFLFPSKYYVTFGIGWGIDTSDSAN